VDELHHVRYLLGMPFYNPLNIKTGKPAKKDKALSIIMVLWFYGFMVLWLLLSQTLNTQLPTSRMQ
jgi:hypothetical protein